MHLAVLLESLVELAGPELARSEMRVARSEMRDLEERSRIGGGSAGFASSSRSLNLVGNLPLSSEDDRGRDYLLSHNLQGPVDKSGSRHIKGTKGLRSASSSRRKLTKEEADCPLRAYDQNRFYETPNIIHALRNAVYRKMPALTVGQINRCLLALERLRQISEHEKSSLMWSNMGASGGGDKRRRRQFDFAGSQGSLGESNYCKNGSSSSTSSLPLQTGRGAADFVDRYTREMVRHVLPEKVAHLTRERVLDVLAQLPDQRSGTSVSPLVLETMVKTYQFEPDDLVFVSELLARVFPLHRQKEGSGRDVLPLQQRERDWIDVDAEVNAREIFAQRIRESSSDDVPDHIRFAVLEEVEEGSSSSNTTATTSPNAIALAIIQYSSHKRVGHWITNCLDVDRVSPVLLPALLSVAAMKGCGTLAEAVTHGKSRGDESAPSSKENGHNMKNSGKSMNGLYMRENAYSFQSHGDPTGDHDPAVFPVTRMLEIAHTLHAKRQEVRPRPLIVAMRAGAALFPESDMLRSWLEQVRDAFRVQKATPMHLCSAAITLKEGLLDLEGRARLAPLAGTIMDGYGLQDEEFDLSRQQFKAKARVRDLLAPLRSDLFHAVTLLEHAEDFTTALKFYVDHFGSIPTSPQDTLSAKLRRVQEALKGSWRRLLDLQSACERGGLTLDEVVVSGDTPGVPESEAFLLGDDE
ncbi:unnamed protein product [Amoebophrya sp. A25]|nr:unnamed protein product [Amoebophrya sp. A25]|eukprot:GSA25T00012773001.1